jgi:hypothetical protein
MASSGFRKEIPDGSFPETNRPLLRSRLRNAHRRGGALEGSMKTSLFAAAPVGSYASIGCATAEVMGITPTAPKLRAHRVYEHLRGVIERLEGGKGKPRA